MRSLPQTKPFSILLLLLLCTLGTFSIAGAQEVVVHPSINEESISRNTLRAIFGMRFHKWSNGLPIKVYVLRDDKPLHIEFTKSILHMFPYQLRRAWDRQVYSGTGQAPNEVDSIEEMRKKIFNTRGAIGYLPLAKISDAKTREQLRILHVR